jgi:uncharacterized cupredoxin-like copper-binding protein
MVSKFVAKFRKNDYGDDYSFGAKKKRSKANKVVRKTENYPTEEYSDFHSMGQGKRKEKRMS